ncbi:MAG: TIGR02301 family protein [Pseudomonadota bacterium]
MIALIPDVARPALSQENSAEQSEEATPKFLPPAYEAQMMRLAEILGALHYLRDLCKADEDQLWREQMQQLIEMEDPSEVRKAQLTARFNQGFRGFREIYRECTDSAIEANNRYITEGGKISAEIPSRYGR